MPKQPVSVETINSICYDIAHDIDFNEKRWIIPALVRQGKLNPVPRSGVIK